MKLRSFINRKNTKKYESWAKEILLAEKRFDLLPPEDIANKLFKLRADTKISVKEKIIQAMALARKASGYILNMPYYEVQLVGALALVDGCIAEMKTGEGKTLTCSAAVAANYALGYSTHVATANEYLAQRDQKQLEKLYSFLGISSSHTVSQMSKSQKKQAYLSHVVYSTAQEFGFDFLRDNLVYSLEEKIQPLNFHQTKAIIDEADFILIDEARTPLIISGEAPLKTLESYQYILSLAAQLKKMDKDPTQQSIFEETYIPGDFWLDEKSKNAYLSEEGYMRIELLLQDTPLLHASQNNLYHPTNSWILHEIINALKAKYLYLRDIDYVVQNEEIVIIDHHTGRLSQGRTWSYGLHQAIEAKENVNINPETMTLGSISVQNYFRTYFQISGMSGTVMQSSEEFEEIYHCKTIQIATNKPMIRINHEDKVYLNLKAKYKYLVEDIVKRNKRGQPILIGTTSVAESEIISNLLHERNIVHHVLNAKNNAQEAQIIAQAGQPYRVTVSTSMAGRGTDIILGGNQEALLEILQMQKDKIKERETYFNELFLQMNISPNEVTQQSSNISYEHMDNYINSLYEPEHIAHHLNSGLVQFREHLSDLMLCIDQQMHKIKTSWQDWRNQVMKAGGLCVIGSSRNESRRIDDQLRGRAGRQGDLGESIFYLSIQDPWVSIFGKNPVFAHLAKTLPEEQSLSSPMVTRAFAKAQSNIESHHFDARKNTFQYDSVSDEGRKKFLNLRNELLTDNEKIKEFLSYALWEDLKILGHENFTYYFEEKLQLDIENHSEIIKTLLGLPLNEILEHIQKFRLETLHDLKSGFNPVHLDLVEHKFKSLIDDFYEDQWTELKATSLVHLDKLWTNHLNFIDDAQKNVGFSALAQKNPLYEFKKICFDSFKSILDEFQEQLIQEFLYLTHHQNDTSEMAEEITEV